MKKGILLTFLISMIIYVMCGAVAASAGMNALDKVTELKETYPSLDKTLKDDYGYYPN